ncbi:1201_t:CDS:1, partial [Racocetra persica]
SYYLINIHVNHQWCNITVPILWANSNFAKKEVIEAFLTNLKTDEQEQIVFFGINIPSKKSLFDH